MVWQQMIWHDQIDGSKECDVTNFNINDEGDKFKNDAINMPIIE